MELHFIIDSIMFPALEPYGFKRENIVADDDDILIDYLSSKMRFRLSYDMKISKEFNVYLTYLPLNETFDIWDLRDYFKVTLPNSLEYQGTTFSDLDKLIEFLENFALLIKKGGIRLLECNKDEMDKIRAIEKYRTTSYNMKKKIENAIEDANLAWKKKIM